MHQVLAVIGLNRQTAVNTQQKAQLVIGDTRYIDIAIMYLFFNISDHFLGPAFVA